MKEHGKVRSVQQPEPKVIDDYSVWIANNIKKVTEPGSDEQPGFDGYEYDLTQYIKDEYIELLNTQVTDTQVALCEVYELLA